MSKIFKFQTVEGGEFTKSNNLLNVQCPVIQGTTMMNASYLELEGVQFFDPATQAQKMENVVLGYADGDQSVEYSTASFIKNIKITSDNLNLLEEQRFINRRTQTERALLSSTSRLENEYFLGRGGIVLLDNNGKANLQIPLQDVCGLGTVSSLSLAKTGRLNFQIELEDQYTVACEYAQLLNVDAVACNTIVNNTGGMEDYDTLTITNTFENVEEALLYFPIDSRLNIAFVAGGDQEEVQAVISNVEVNANVCTLTFTEPFVTLADTEEANTIQISNNVVATVCNDVAGGDARNLVVVPHSEASDFQVGKVYTIGCLDATPRFRVVEAVLKTAEQDGDAVNLTFTTECLPAGALTLVQIRRFAFLNLDYSIDKINLVVRNNATLAPAPVFSFDTYHVEMQNQQDGLLDWRQQYDLENGVYCVYLMHPMASLVGVRDTVSSFRMSINNIDTTNRDVELDSANNSLYYDRLYNGYATDLMNLNLVNFSADVFIIPELVPMNGARNLLNVRLYSTEPMTAKIVYLFKKLMQEF